MNGQVVLWHVFESSEEAYKESRLTAPPMNMRALDIAIMMKGLM